MSLRTSSRLALSCLAATIVAASLASCSSDLLNPVTHTWSLESIREVPLPDTIPNTSAVIVITSGTGTTNSDGNYTFTFSGTTDGVQGVVASDHGHWSINSSEFLFRSANGIPDYIGALNTGSIRVSVAGQVVHSTTQTIDMVFSQAP
jgi:hypothetical protein